MTEVAGGVGELGGGTHDGWLADGKLADGGWGSKGGSGKTAGRDSGLMEAYGGNTMLPEVDPPLPESLRACLARFRSCWRRRIVGDACARAGVAAGFAFLVVFAMDRAGCSPAWARFAVLTAGILAVALAFQLAWRRMAECGSALAAARMIARALPATGGNLLGAVELTGAGGDGTSPRLREVIIDRASVEVAGMDFRPALPGRDHAARRAFVAVGALVTAVAIGCPRESANSLARLLEPFGDEERYVRTLRLPAFEASKTPREIPVSWVDENGLRGAEGFSLRMDPVVDHSPIRVPPPTRAVEEAVVVRENGVRRIKPRAADTIRVPEEYEAVLEHYQRAASAGR